MSISYDNRYERYDNNGNPRMDDHVTGKKCFYLTFALQHEDKENLDRQPSMMFGRTLGSNVTGVSSMISDMFKTVTGSAASDDKMSAQMVETLEQAISAVLKDKGYAANIAHLTLPPLRENFKPNTTFSGEKLFVFRVKLLRRESVNKEGLFFMSDFQCCQGAVDLMVPLSSDCQRLSKTTPPELMNELRTSHGLFVRCEGATMEEQTGLLMKYGWSPDSWGGL
eukprot:gnl/TRDRNA2_/TRDRNA2_144522_c0_seq1.p1 gnl/TRDRNA2_/TRDRNA2_144522_c0~~gnl/TRDRNA2_/TRDRNA2_144522_c0_seq1.p1  ORF type:complete len:224 (+),score=38.33 gnl/TRDRNA2_/TRDRNA2_144522_c0_seq1:51-722(+)